MDIEKIVVGDYKTNCYLLKKDNKVLLIDPGAAANKIISRIGNNELVGIIITHHHPDHDGAVKEIVAKYDILVYDIFNLCEGENRINNFYFNVIYTPGHRCDEICIYFIKEKIIFCGDFIFKDSIGRCDLPYGNMMDMIKSIEKIKSYNHDIILYPGHGVITSLGYEVNNNIYFNNIV